MKKVLMLFLLAVVSEVQAQWINGLSISPANPTTADSIFAYADCSFTAGSCPPWTLNHFINGNAISANALHCVGMLTVICPYTDTFALGLLPAGTYTFTFQVDEGHGGPPCTPGIVPGPSASMTFTVSVATSVQQISGDEMFSFSPNPVKDKITVANKTKAPMHVRIFDVTGKMVMEKNISAGSEEISASDLKPGIYVLENRGSRFRFVKQ